MEGKYTKISAVVGVLALMISIIPFVTAGEEKDYSGIWKMQVSVTEAAYNAYRGMQIHWILQITQHSGQISGTGEKIAIGASKLPFKSRTAILINGTVKDGRFILQYTERGARRESQGMFKGKFEGDEFSGIFVQTASDSKGEIMGRKEE